jgi:hypothetical protein
VFAYGAAAGPVAFVSTIKLRTAGFNAAVDTRDAFRAALQSFINRKLLPIAGRERGMAAAGEADRSRPLF